MRYINLRLTYLLTYLHSHVKDITHAPYKIKQKTVKDKRRQECTVYLSSLDELNRYQLATYK